MLPAKCRYYIYIIIDISNLVFFLYPHFPVHYNPRKGQVEFAQVLLSAGGTKHNTKHEQPICVSCMNHKKINVNVYIYIYTQTANHQSKYIYLYMHIEREIIMWNAGSHHTNAAHPYPATFPDVVQLSAGHRQISPCPGLAQGCETISQRGDSEVTVVMAIISHLIFMVPMDSNGSYNPQRW